MVISFSTRAPRTRASTLFRKMLTRSYHTRLQTNSWIPQYMQERKKPTIEGWSAFGTWSEDVHWAGVSGAAVSFGASGGALATTSGAAAGVIFNVARIFSSLLKTLS